MTGGGPAEPIEVGLADVYRLDFGRRDVDLPTWSVLAALAGPGPILDVGCGDGRATRDLRADGREVYGIDPDVRLLAAARDAGIKTERGTADDPASYRYLPRVALALCAYSTFWLLQHDVQERALARMAEAIKPGGLVAVEVFVPVLTADREVEEAVLDPNDPRRPPWVRLSRFSLFPDLRQTGVERFYGPSRDRFTMVLRERLYWRDPDEQIGRASCRERVYVLV